AGELDPKGLKNNLDKVMAEMASLLAADHPGDLPRMIDLAALHGDERFAQRYALAELLTEYVLLRPIIVEHVTRRLGRPLDPAEASSLHLAVDITVQQGVLAYDKHHREELEHQNENRAKYLSFLSHDLRGGLNGVLLMIEVLRRELQPHAQFGESIEDLDTMRRSILDTVGTMDRFLQAEKLRSGRIQPQLGPVVVRDLLTEVATAFVPQAKAKGLDLRIDVPDGTTITSDKNLLVLILQNLISNAVKYTKAGDLRVAAESPCADTTAICRLSVIDTGPGIDAQGLENLTKPYTRGATHGQKGTGLGLTIARHAADLLGAKLWATSEVGKGTAFHVDIPAGK
ncbi:MAG TPA: HAMP domain-containing sensor histidine kinase, partial [Tepidisphaeraceae bacterium]|nr:HAMP domain-containing sensor histidine kinase [Tepidisphaeraceae bacterium]